MAQPVLIKKAGPNQWDEASSADVAASGDLATTSLQGMMSPAQVAKLNLVPDSGVSFTWRGTWSSASFYAVNDAVNYNGASYICTNTRSPNVSPPPSDPGHWDIMAQGSTGIQGITGLRGITGAGLQGATGIQGLTGVRGMTGAGIQGATGVIGIQGETGIQGEMGPQGACGIDGATGIQGLTGPGGSGFNFLGYYTGSASYNYDDVVLSSEDNALYIVNFPYTNINVDPAFGGGVPYWSLYLPAGVPGAAGSGIQGETGLQGITGAIPLPDPITDHSNVESIDWNGRGLFDSVGYQSVNWNAYQLYYSGGSSIPSINWQSSQACDTSGTPTIDYNNHYLIGSSGNNTVDWFNGYLLAMSLPTVLWLNCQLNDGFGNGSLAWSSRVLFDAQSMPEVALDWSNRYLIDSSGSIHALDWANRYLLGSSSNVVANWGTQQLIDVDGGISVGWASKQLYDGYPNNCLALDWYNRELIGADGSTLCFQWTSGAGSPQLGFFGIAPVSQQALTLGVSTTDDIIQALKNLGLSS